MITKKIMIMGIMCSLSISLVACGKKNEETIPVVDIIQETPSDYDFDKETSEELEELVNEIYNEEQISSTEEEVDSYSEEFQLCKLLPEMKGTKITDNKVQIFDIIVRTDGSMTLADLEELVKNSPALSTYYDIYRTENELMPIDGLCDDMTQTVSIWDVRHDNMMAGQVAEFELFNPTVDQMIENSEYIILSCRIVNNSEYYPYGINCYYAEDINLGINDSLIRASSDYEIYKSELNLAPIAYNDIVSVMENSGLKNVEYEDKYHPGYTSDDYEITCGLPDGRILTYTKSYSFILNLDEKLVARIVSHIGFQKEID